MYDFDYNFIRNGGPIVTCSTIGLAFNSGARALLGYPESVEIGFDQANNAIAVREHESESQNNYYVFEPKERNGWVRCSMRNFMSYLSQQTGIDFSKKAVQFTPKIDKETGLFIVMIDEEHMKNKTQNKTDNS